MKKKLLSLLMVATLTFAMPLTAFAQDYGNGAENGTVTVTANVTASYSIRLPATIVLTLQNDGSYSSNYEVGVKANIPTDKEIVVTPAPSIVLTKVNGSDTANASVTQTHTVWMAHDMGGNYPSKLYAGVTEYVNTTGTIISNDLCEKELGASYSGDLTFTFSYQNFNNN